MKSARLTAFELLYEILQNGAYSNLTIDSHIKDLSAKDRALATQLVYGVIERKITLDYLIDQYLKTKPKPKVKIILYLGTYQLYFTDKIPSAVAINESVLLAKAVGCDYYSKLINAVLRKIDRERIEINTLDDLSVRYSCPQMLINMWNKQYGKDKTLQILKSINSKPPVFAVPNKLYVNADELQYELLCEGIDAEVNGELVQLLSSFDLSKSRAFQNGLFHIEDESSYLCARALDAQSGDTVLDMCAAPGGKTFTVAEQMQNQGSIYAYDIHPHKVKLLENGALRLGLTNISAAENDAAVYRADIPMADKILCDVPCSGYGIIRRKPEIRYKTLDSVKELPSLQLQILSTSAQYLKNGGRLIYSTCTLNKKENERVVEAFLANNSHFSLDAMTTLFPSENGGDGFFYAIIHKND